MPIGRSRALSTVRSNSVDHGRKTNRPRLGPAGSTVRPSRHPPEQVRQPGPLTVTHVPRVDASPERLLAIADQLAEGDAAARELSAAYRRLAQIPDEDTRRRLLINLDRRRRQLKEDQTRLAADARRILIDRRADLFRGDLEVTRAEMELRRLDPDAETLLRRLGRTSLPDGGPRRPEDHDTFVRLMALPDRKLAELDANAFWPFLTESEQDVVAERIEESGSVLSRRRPNAVATRRARLTQTVGDLISGNGLRTKASNQATASRTGIDTLVARAIQIIRRHEHRLGRPLNPFEERMLARRVVADDRTHARTRRSGRAKPPGSSDG